MKNRKVIMARRPEGELKPTDFDVVEEELGELPEGHVLLQVEHLSIDAFIRTTLEEEGFHERTGINQAVTALGTGKVLASSFDGLNQGDEVFGPMGSQTFAQMPGAMFRKLDNPDVPARTYLGALGLTTGLTAHAGMVSVGEVKAGDTVVVSAAAGAVGGVACQIARIKGATVIGVAGGPAKVDYLLKEIGCDSAIDYKNDDVHARLGELAPNGVDIFFDNVGGELLDHVLDHIATGARVVICGAISQYGDMKNVRGPQLYLRVAERNASIRGFTVMHYASQYGAMEAELSGWLKSGELKMPEHIVEGIENFPEALNMLFTGGHMGKLLVAVQPGS